MDNGVLREHAYQDVGSLLEWIKTRQGLDHGRVMVFGTSYGGHVALVAGTRYGDRIRCLVDNVGISNLATFLQNTETTPILGGLSMETSAIRKCAPFSTGRPRSTTPTT